MKDVLITILSLALCLSLAALIYETRQHSEDTRQISEQAAQLQSQQQALGLAQAKASQDKAQSERALHRAQLSLKAGYEAQGIVAGLKTSR